LAGIESPRALAAADVIPPSATALIGDLTLLVPMAGLIDAAAEAERLSKLLSRSNSDLEKIRGRLANDNFVSNAPDSVVATERQRLSDLERTVSNFTTQLDRVRQLLRG